MQESYKHQGIQVLPDNIIQQLNQQKLKADLPEIYDAFIDKKDYLSDLGSTQILSNNHLIQGDEFIPYINLFHQYFHNFYMIDLDKFNLSNFL